MRTGGAKDNSQHRAGSHTATKGGALAAAAIATLVVAPSLAMLRQPVGGDEMGLLLYPLKMSDGLVLHRDFFSPYGPGAFRLVQGAFSVWGPSAPVERGVGVTYHLMIALAFLVLAKPLGRHAAVAAGLTCSLTFLWFTPVAYAWFGGLALATWSLALLANSRSHVAAAASGTVAGLIPFWRPEMAILWLAAIPLCLATRRCVAYVLGLTVGLIPLALHVTAAGANVFQSVIASRLSVNAQTSISNIDMKVWILLVACLLGLCIQVRLSLTAHANRPLLLSTSIFSLLVAPQALQRTDIYHAIYAACIIFPATMAMLVNAMDHTTKARAVTPLRIAAVGIATTAVIIIGSFALTQLPSSDLNQGQRSLPTSPETRDRLSRIIASLRTSVPPGSSVFMGAQDMSRPGATDSELYFLLPDYRAPFFYLELAPGASERAGSRLRQEVISADALVLRDTPRQVVDMDFPHIPPGVRDVNEIVRTQFCLVDTVGVSRIYVRGTC